MVAGALGAFFAPGSQAWSPSGPHWLHFCVGSGRFGIALPLAPQFSPFCGPLGLCLAFGCFCFLGLLPVAPELSAQTLQKS